MSIEANYIKRKLALNIGIPLILKIISLTLLEEIRIYLYKDYILRITTKNILKTRKKLIYTLYYIILEYL